MAYIRDHPARLFSLPGHLRSGKAALKAELAAKTDIDVALLPYEPDVLALIEQARAADRPVVLATASHESYATAIAAHLDCFDAVIATHDGENLKGQAKADILVERYGEGQFDYAGNSLADLPVWEVAESAYVVNPDLAVVSRAKMLNSKLVQLPDQRHPLQALMKAMRLHQWAKNALIFVPLLAGHHLLQPNQLWVGLLAFLCFGLCASGVYLLNDLLDLQDDRLHPRKKLRPFAAGTLPIRLGLIAIPACLIASFLMATLYLPTPFAITLLCYCLLTCAYSVRLKRIIIVDVLVLALLYTLRIIAGITVFNALLTFWLLAFSMFIFLSLALVKRCAELTSALQRGDKHKTPGRGYYPGDLTLLTALGCTCGFLSVIVLAFYVQDPSTTALYRQPELIWLACPVLLFWISRVWFITHSGRMVDDPMVFAITDKVSLLTGALFGTVFWIAT